MVDKSMVDLLSPLGLPIAYRQFLPYKDAPVPEPPYVIYLFGRERAWGSDSSNLVKERTVHVELYTNAKEIQLEEKLEELLDSYEYDKIEDFIESEKLYQVVYIFTQYIKK